MRDKAIAMAVVLLIGGFLFAATSVNDSRTANNTIRDETGAGQNTATRIGNAMNGILDAAVLEVSAKSASFAAASGYLYVVDSTSGAVTVTTPASPVVGDMFGIVDKLGIFETNNCTVNFGTKPLHALSSPNNLFIGDANFTHRRFRYDGVRWYLIHCSVWIVDFPTS